VKRADKYADVLAQIRAVIEGESYDIARLATTCCLLDQAFGSFYWTGFYLVDSLNPDELVIGPYQGTLGCLRIPFGKGVCGRAAQSGKTIIVPDVHNFPGHIACDSKTNSEIVVPVFDRSGRLRAVLDVDSLQPDNFDDEDRAGLEAICALLYQ